MAKVTTLNKRLSKMTHWSYIGSVQNYTVYTSEVKSEPQFNGIPNDP